MNIEYHFKYWVDSLIEEGYDLSDYTWDEIYEEYLSEMGRQMTTGQYQVRQRDAKEKPYRARQQRYELGVVKTNSGYVAKPEGTVYDPNKSAAAVQLANRLNRESGFSNYYRSSKSPGERVRLGGAKSPEGKPIAMARTAASARTAGTSLQNAPQSAVTLNKGYAAKLGGKDVNVYYKNIGGKIQRQTIQKGTNKMLKTENFDFSSPSKVASDMAYLYQSIYEGKKKVDQDMDGDNDFADVMIARMVAAGVPRAEAIRRVRNKNYNI